MSRAFKLLLPLIVTASLLVAAVRADESDSIPLDEVIQAMEQFMADCDPVPTKDQMKEMATNKRDPQRGTMCAKHCMMTKMEMMKEGSNQLEKEKTKEMMAMLMPDEDKAMNEIIDKCNQKVAGITDKCEAAHASCMCMLDEFKERNVAIPKVV